MFTSMRTRYVNCIGNKKVGYGQFLSEVKYEVKYVVMALKHNYYYFYWMIIVVLFWSGNFW
jgi:hypothetical protein